jgi:hypothetical protein
MAFINDVDVSEKNLRCKKKGAANMPRLLKHCRLFDYFCLAASSASISAFGPPSR